MGGGGWDIKPDRDIEYWAAYRENTHRWFKINSKNGPKLFLYLGVIPFVTYYLIKKAQIQSDKQNGHPPSDYM